MHGKIINIYVYPEAGADAIAHSSVQIIAGPGIVGDRYYKNLGTFSKKITLIENQQITFIESEFIDEFNQQYNCQLTYSQLRRNVITHNVDLNSLVGKKFHFGNNEFKGIELCEPCAYLAQAVENKLLPAMVGKAGLRAQILTDGKLTIDDHFKKY